MIEIISAIVGAIVAAVANHFVEKRKQRRQLEIQKEKFETQTLESAKSIHSDLSENFGWKAKKLISKMTVLNKQGDARFLRSWKGIQITTGETRSRLPGYFWSSPAGSLKSPPVLSLPNEFPKKVDLQIEKIGNERCEFYADIAGSLTDYDPPLDYDIHWEQKGTTLLNSEAVKEAYKDDHFKYDYFSYYVGPPPIEKLILEVNFPFDVTAEFYSAVFDGRTEYQVDKEFQRTRTGLDKLPSGARFTIEEPLIGLTYLIYWIFKD